MKVRSEGDKEYEDWTLQTYLLNELLTLTLLEGKAFVIILDTLSFIGIGSTKITEISSRPVNSFSIKALNTNQSTLASTFEASGR